MASSDRGAFVDAMNGAMEFTIPIAHRMGVKVVEAGRGRAAASAPMEGNSNHFGVMYAGVLFTVPVLSSDPLPRRQRQWGRAVDMFVEMPLHAFFGVIVMMASAPLVATFSRPPASWGVDVMSDQGIAGGLAWSYGELPSLVLLLIVFARWEREERHAHDTPRADGRTTVEAELDDYNGYLERLRAHDG